MYDYTRHWNINKRFTEKYGGHTKKTINRFSTKDSLYLEHHTQYGKCYSLQLEALVVGITVGSREVPGRKGL
jgi:hypothetical protein